MLMWALAAGCSSPGALDIDPINIDFGTVDFQTDACMDCACDDHCAGTDVTLTNKGDSDLNVSLPEGWDGEHLCLVGFEEPDAELVLPRLKPGSSYVFTFTVCGYVVGAGRSELTTLVEGETVFHSDGEQATSSLTWSFTPVRDMSSNDTGDTGP